MVAVFFFDVICYSQYENCIRAVASIDTYGLRYNIRDHAPWTAKICLLDINRVDELDRKMRMIPGYSGYIIINNDVLMNPVYRDILDLTAIERAIIADILRKNI